MEYGMVGVRQSVAGVWKADWSLLVGYTNGTGSAAYSAMSLMESQQGGLRLFEVVNSYEQMMNCHYI
jgi:hypothetical protein